MTLILVGGQTKNVGKTTLVCNIIAAFPTVKWTAVKISNHAHTPQDCELLREGTGWTIWRQNSTNDHSDTARFLRSGADRGLLVQSSNSSLKEACASLEQEFGSTAHAIVESASAAKYLNHDLLLIVLDAARNDFKQSARQQLDHTDAFLLRNSGPVVSGGIHLSSGVPVISAFPSRLDPALVSMLAATLGTGF